jgi:hypothetical protein
MADNVDEQHGVARAAESLAERGRDEEKLHTPAIGLIMVTQSLPSFASDDDDRRAVP